MNHKLQNQIECYLTEMESVLLNFPWENPKAYALWLAQTYHMVTYSTRIIALAGACAPLDRVSFHQRRLDHLDEERGHERLALMDIKNIGFQIENLPCLVPTSCIYQIQFFWIQHKSPLAFYGYTLALELLAEKFGREIGQRVIGSHGSKASNFLRVHSEEDEGHNQATFKDLEGISSEELDLIIENMKLSGALYKQMLIECMKAAGVHQGSRAA